MGLKVRERLRSADRQQSEGFCSPAPPDPPRAVRRPGAPRAGRVSSAAGLVRGCAARRDGVRSSARPSPPPPARPGGDLRTSNSTHRPRCGLHATWAGQSRAGSLGSCSNWTGRLWGRRAGPLRGPDPQLGSRPLRPGEPTLPSPANLRPGSVPSLRRARARKGEDRPQPEGRCRVLGASWPQAPAGYGLGAPARPPKERARRRERESALWAARRALSCAHGLARSKC